MGLCNSAGRTFSGMPCCLMLFFLWPGCRQREHHAAYTHSVVFPLCARWSDVWRALSQQSARAKRVYTPPATVALLLSRSVARPRGHRAKKSYGVHDFLAKAREKGIHHRSGNKGFHHRRFRRRKRENRRISTVVAYTFSSLIWMKTWGGIEHTVQLCRSCGALRPRNLCDYVTCIREI